MSSLRARGCATVLGTALVLGGWAAPAMAQGRGRPLNPTGRQVLDFGTVFPGVPEVVSRTDPLRSGQFDVGGERFAEVRLDFTLPSALVEPGGQSIPLVFGADDGGFSTQNNINAATGFDPRVALIARLSNAGRLFIWLGGTALPAPTQAPGLYTAMITMLASYTGN